MWGNSATHIWSSIMSSPPPLPRPLPLPLPPRPPPVQDVDVALSVFGRLFGGHRCAPGGSPSLSSQHAPNLVAFAAGGEIKGTSRVGTQHGTARNALGRATREFRTNGARCTDGSIRFPPLPPPDRHGPMKCGTNNGTTLQGMTPRRHYTSGQHITSVFKAAILKAPAAPPPSPTSIPSPRRHQCFLGMCWAGSFCDHWSNRL